MIEWIATHLTVYGPLLVGVMVMLETALVIGLLLPAGPTIIVAAAFALEGHFSFTAVVIYALVGAALGDSFGFMIGRYGGKRVMRGSGLLARSARRHQDRASALFERRGVLSITLARLILFARTLMPLAAGSTRLSYRRFLVFDLLGVAGWGFLSLGFAYGAARGWQVGVDLLGLGWVALLAAVTAVALLAVKGRVFSAPSPLPLVVVGLTGNVASGKSAVAGFWGGEGVPVVSADLLARQAVETGSPGLAAVVEAFGRGILKDDGSLDRSALGALVFRDEEARGTLEAILHPRIWVLCDRWMRKRFSERVSLTISEVPLLFEAGLERDVDFTVLVDASESVRLTRLIDSRGLDEEQARGIMASQMDPALKRDRADYVLSNEGTLAELQSAAGDLLDQIRIDAQAGPGLSSGHIRIDMHLHTSASFDCLSDPMRVIEAAKERGVQRIAITDHNRLGVALEMAKAFPETVIPGEEVKTAEGIDLIGLYLVEEIPKGTSAPEVCRLVHEQGGIVYLPHPYAGGKGASGRYAEELAPLVDVVEVFNARLHPGRLNEPGEELAARWAKARGAGSDAHTVGEVAGGFVEVTDHPNEPAALLEALAGSRVRGVTTPWSVHLASTWAKVRKRLPFSE